MYIYIANSIRHFINPLGLSGIFVDAVEEVLGDDGFEIPSPLAAAARDTATSLLTWCCSPANQQSLSTFSAQLFAKLEPAFAQPTRKIHSQRGMMWGTYHTIRSSDDFSSSWAKFLQESLGCEACPIFYQYVTDKLFRRLIVRHFPVSGESGDHTPVVSGSLSYEETNALRYAAGYVCRAVRKRIASQARAHELLLSLEELLDDTEDGGEDNDDRHPSSCDWTNLSNRGGLLHVTDEAFAVFHAIEQVVRQHLRKDKARKISSGIKKELCASIMCDENVLFYWCTVAANMDKQIGTMLLLMIVELWVTIRGFSFAGAWMELYKQSTKKTLQRSKGLRKALFTSQTK